MSPILRFLFIIMLLIVQNFSSGQRVLMIGIDGARADAVEFANTPNLDQLIENGIYSPDALNDDITISGPGWSAILCGVWSPKHLVSGNNFDINNYNQYPSFINRIEAHNPDLNTVSICHWSPINDEIVMSDADLIMNETSDLAVSIKAIDQLTNSDPDVMFLHFDEVDHAGHGNGFDTSVPAYISKIENVDLLVGNVIQALENRSNYENENWIILITSDHGGLNFSHGGSSFQEQNVMFIASGLSIPTELVEKDSSYVLNAPYNCLEDSIELTFDGNDDFVHVPNNPLFNFGSSQDFTVEFRVKTSIAADVSIVGNKDWDTGLNKGFVFSFAYPSGPAWKVNIGDGSNRIDINTGGAIADGNWYTISASFDRDGQLKIYQDGTLMDQANMSIIGDIDTNQGLFFGTDINNAYDFNGVIAEVRVWDTLIQGVDINQWHCSEIDNSHPNFSNLIGYWKMKEGPGSIQTQDFSGNNLHGIINNATWYEVDSAWVYDYSQTPRVVDMSISALGHLCIPVDQNWNLDGQSWVPDCTYNLRECVNPGQNIWVGPSTGIWHLDANWSRGFIPLVCDHVIIPNGNTVNIDIGQMAECYTLDVQLNAELCIPQGAEVKVLNP